MSFILFRDTECARPSADQPTYLPLGTCLDLPPGTSSIQVGALPGCPNSGQPTLFLSSNPGCAFPTTTTSGSGGGSSSGGGSGSESGGGSGGSGGSSGGSTYSGSGGASGGGHNSSSSTSGGTSGSGSSHSSGGDHTSALWPVSSPTFTQGSRAVTRGASDEAGASAQGFTGVKTSGVCTQFKDLSIASVQFACPESARQPGPTATSLSGGGESVRIQGTRGWHGAMWWTLIGGYAMLGLLGGG